MNAPSPTRTVAANCRAEAARRGRTAQDIADATGIHRVTLGRRLNGSASFTINELVAIAACLSVPLSTLLAGVEDAHAKAASA